MASTLTGLLKTLTWSDFGTPRAGSAPAPGTTATTAETIVNVGFSGLAFDPVPGTTGQFTLRDSLSVTITFNRSQSFVMAWFLTRSQAEKDRMLNHEQGHYNISALIARDFFVDVMLLKSQVFATAQAGLNAVTAIQTASINKTQIVQNLYDRETNHSNVATQQASWDGFIRSAFNTARTPPSQSPGGVAHKQRLIDILRAAGKTI